MIWVFELERKKRKSFDVGKGRFIVSSRLNDKVAFPHGLNTYTKNVFEGMSSTSKYIQYTHEAAAAVEYFA